MRTAGKLGSIFRHPASIALTVLLGAVIGGMLIGLASCSEVEAPTAGGPLSPKPTIELVEVAPTAVSALQDSLVFYLRYTDGDGDLGFLEADSAVVYLTDNRFPLTEEYHVPPVAPIGDEIAVTGVWLLVLGRTIMQDPTADTEIATFSVRVRDRAGNWSNTEISEPLSISAD